MVDEQGPEHAGNHGDKPGFIARLVGSAGFLAVSQYWQKVDADKDVPRVTGGNRNAERLAREAEDLAERGVDPVTAVKKLLQSARGRHKDLKAGSAYLRQEGLWMEVERFNLAVRLLNAAATEQPIEPTKPEHQERFAVLGRLFDLPPKQGFHELKAHAPALAGLEAEVREAGAKAQEQGLGPEAMHYPNLWAVVGPRSSTSDPIAKSHVASYVAFSGLAEIGRESLGQSEDV